MVALSKVKMLRYTDNKSEQRNVIPSISWLQMTNKFCHLLNIGSDEEMPYKGFSLILSRNFCHHKDMNNDHRLGCNKAVFGLKLLGDMYIHLSL